MKCLLAGAITAVLLLAIFSSLKTISSCTVQTLQDNHLRGTCPNTTQVVPLGGNAIYTCSYDTVDQLLTPYWNITGYGAIKTFPSNSPLRIVSSPPSIGTTRLTVKMVTQFINTVVNVSCGLTPYYSCHFSCPTVISVIETQPVQLIAFGN